VLTSLEGTNGAVPVAGVALDASGNLYGTTQFGGAQDRGAAYESDAKGRFGVLQDFGAVDGYEMNEPSGLNIAPSGSLLVTTYGGKWGGCVIFELQPAPR
jgi:uncharacterized repeat protein (TIGR03803 family)